MSGSASNMAIALLFGLLLRLIASGTIQFSRASVEILTMIVFTNILLAIFNLVPIPPLDGSKLLFAFFPDRLQQIRGFFETYGLVLMMFFVLFLWQMIFPVIQWLFSLVTGIAF